MHEYGLMQDVVGAVLQMSPGNREGKVVRVRIEVGEFLVASRESLQTAFEILTRGTALEGSALDVKEVPGRAVCEACGFRGSSADLGDELCEPPAVLLCPTCGAPLLVTEGAGITLTDVQLQDRGRSDASGPGSGGR
jgi:hydrogenase nickel incorporation protein HypA/HybF